MNRKAASSTANRLAYYDRRLAFQGFAALVSLPLGLCLAAVFDGGALGEIVRAAITLAIK